MNEHDTIDLLTRRQNVARIAYNQTTIEHWQHALADVALADAVRAFDAIVATGEADVSVPRLRSWLRSERRHEQATGAPIGRPDCPTCDATGFAVLEHEHGTDRYGPCPDCRP